MSVTSSESKEKGPNENGPNEKGSKDEPTLNIQSVDSAKNPKDSGEKGDLNAGKDSTNSIIQMLCDTSALTEELAAYTLDIDPKPIASYTLNDVVDGYKLFEEIRNLICLSNGLKKLENNRRILLESYGMDTEEVKPKRQEFEMKFPKIGAPGKAAKGTKYEKYKNGAIKSEWKLSYSLDWNAKTVVLKILRDITMAASLKDRLMTGLENNFDILEKDSMDFVMIQTLLNHGQSPDQRFDLLDIWKHESSGDRDVLVENKKRALLWYGAPPSKLSTFFMDKDITGSWEEDDGEYGTRLVFNDMCAPAVKRTKVPPGSHATLLLCEVSMEKTMNVDKWNWWDTLGKEMRENGADSVIGAGGVYPDEDGMVVRNGVSVPLGKKCFRFEGYNEKNAHEEYNMFAVASKQQVKVKFVVRVRLHDTTI